MSLYDKIKNDLTVKCKCLQEDFQVFDDISRRVDVYFDKAEKALQKLKKTGEFVEDDLSLEDVISVSSNSSLKENLVPNRSSQNATKKSRLSNSSSQATDALLEKNIKKEKLSSKSSLDSGPPLKNNVKQEKEDMPAPVKLPPRKKKVKTERQSSQKHMEVRETRSTRSKKRLLGTKESTSRDSDVLVQDVKLPVVELSDSDDSVASNNDKPVRSKNKTATKRVRGEDSDSESQCEIKKSKSGSPSKDERGSSGNKNLPIKAEKNKTVAQNNKKNQKTKTVETVSQDELITDDDSEEGTLHETAKKKQDIPSNEKTTLKSSENHETAVIMDATVVLEKQNFTADLLNKFDSNNAKTLKTKIEQQNPEVTEDLLDHNAVKDLLTDDESEDEKEKIKTNVGKQTNAGSKKQLFSPYESSPVKKKVAAFERLQAENKQIPVRTTRTKTKALAKDQETEQPQNNQPEETSTNLHEPPKSAVKEKARLFTPILSKFVPKVCSTSRLPNRLHLGGTPTANNKTSYASTNESLSSSKSISALKASQAEFREREKRRREKEAEALKKKEALIQAQIEEKKKKRQEKQMKAQQQREAMEKESQKKLEIQKIKEERHRQLVAEREEKLQKQRAEMEKKRLQAKIKAAEEKKKEELKKQAEENQTNDNTFVVSSKKEKRTNTKKPIYLTTKPPRLPTDDCYDSDEEEYKTHKPQWPDWAREPEMKAMQLAMIYSGEKLKNTFFCCQAQTPDLQDIFENIDPRKLKRTSSAIWRKPPRYTLMLLKDQSILEDSEEEYFSEDYSD